MPSQRRQRAIKIAGVTVASAILILLYRIAVMTADWMPKCIFKTLTGFDCPGCGSQRALQALLHGEPARAIHHNLLIPFALLYIAGVCVSWIMADTTQGALIFRRLTSPAVTLVIAGIIIGWMIARNILGI